MTLLTLFFYHLHTSALTNHLSNNTMPSMFSTWSGFGDGTVSPSLTKKAKIAPTAATGPAATLVKGKGKVNRNVHTVFDKQQGAIDMHMGFILKHSPETTSARYFGLQEGINRLRTDMIATVDMYDYNKEDARDKDVDELLTVALLEKKLYTYCMWALKYAVEKRDFYKTKHEFGQAGRMHHLLPFL